MKDIRLSYVLSTYNKLSFLRIVLGDLILSRKEDEEIIVIDGGSTDGTPGYLSELKAGGKIDSFLSEKDQGESHGFNKGFLLAKGTLIKVVTDDDAFNHSVIQKCKEFMLLHPDIDIMAGNTGNVNIDNISGLCCYDSFQDDFKLWRAGSLKNFFFNGTCLMIRKSSLNLTGLFSTHNLLADMEFSLRVTGIARIAWCTGIISVRILNSDSNYIKYAERAKIEDEKLCEFYNYKHSHIRRQEELKNRSTYKKIRAYLSGVKGSFANRGNSEVRLTSPGIKLFSYKDVYEYCMKWMTGHELNKEISFLSKD